MNRFLLTAALATVMSVASFSAMADDSVKVGDHVVTHHKVKKHHVMHKDMSRDMNGRMYSSEPSDQQVYVRDVPQWRGKDIQALQQSLRDSGFYKAPVTGVWDQETANAVASYQYANGIEMTGTLNEQTAKKIGLQPVAMSKVGGTIGENAAPMPRHTPMRPRARVVHRQATTTTAAPVVVEKTTTTTH